MKLEKKHWIWIGLGVAVLTTGIFIHKKRKANREKALAESNEKKPIQYNSARVEPVQETQEVNVPIMQVAHFPLKKGSVGYEVKVIQEYMNSTCKASLEATKTYPLELNGVWDEKMETSAISCASVKRNEIDEDMYNRIYRDMKAANILPEN